MRTKHYEPPVGMPVSFLLQLKDVEADTPSGAVAKADQATPISERQCGFIVTEEDLIRGREMVRSSNFVGYPGKKSTFELGAPKGEVK
jgi:hypothetical protein